MNETYVDELIKGLEQVSRACLTDRERRFVVEAIAALCALRKDQERLDKLWRNTGGTGDDEGGWTAFWSFPFIPRYQDLCGWPDDIRDAIDAMDDAAMAAESARGDAA